MRQRLRQTARSHQAIVRGIRQFVSAVLAGEQAAAKRAPWNQAEAERVAYNRTSSSTPRSSSKFWY